MTALALLATVVFMTNTQAAYPLMLLYRLMKYSPSLDGIFLGYGKLDDTEDQFLVRRVKLASRFVVARSDLFQMVSIGRALTEHHLVFDSTSSKPTLADLAAELRSDHAKWPPPMMLRPYSDYELLAAVIALGDVSGTYGSSYWGSEQDVLHLLACGVNWELFRGVGEMSWTEWGGSFGEDMSSTKFGASVHCRCETETWSPSLDFGLEPPSIASLLSALGEGALEKIFSV